MFQTRPVFVYAHVDVELLCRPLLLFNTPLYVVASCIQFCILYKIIIQPCIVYIRFSTLFSRSPWELPYKSNTQIISEVPFLPSHKASYTQATFFVPQHSQQHYPRQRRLRSQQA